MKGSQGSPSSFGGLAIHMASRFTRLAADVFSVDLRSLALFRALLGAVLFVTLLLRFADLSTFYADSGVMPRAWLLMSESPLRWSLHFANGSALFQGLMLAVQCVAALALLFGYRTRLAVVVSWLLLASLNSRNPLVLIGGDYLMVALLFWAMFLPIGARWSVDAALSTAPPPAEHRHLSWAGAALLTQVLAVYFFSAILKSDPVWWPDGTAVYYALSLDRFATPLGQWLREALPWTLQPLTYYVYFLELVGPLLALSPWLQKPLRFAVLCLLVLMHLGFLVFLEVGLFPFVSLTSLIVLLGGWFWDWADRRFDHGRWLKIYYDRDCGFCRKSCVLFVHFLVLRRTEVLPAQDSQRASALMLAQDSWVVIDAEDVAHTKWDAWVALLRHSLLFGWAWRLAAWRGWQRPGNAVYDWVGRHRDAFGLVTAALLPERAVRFEAPRWTQVAAAVALASILLWNLASIRVMPDAAFRVLSSILYVARLDQFWDMFAPFPGRDDGWYVVPGRLVNGTEVDVRHPERGAVTYAKPEYVTDEIKNFRWQAYEIRLYDPRFRHHRLAYARYLCRQWNRDVTGDQRLESLRIVYLLERTPPPGQQPAIEQIVLWRHNCLAGEPDGKSADAD